MPQPNILLIMSDQHNARIMGCAGDQFVRTPNLDALATCGTRLTAVYTACPLCLPARMSFLTGQTPANIGTLDNGSILASDVPTFAHSLGAGGYETVLCGRMHFEGPDQFHGFGQRIFGDCQGPDVLSHLQGSGLKKTNGQHKHAVEVAGHGRTGYQAFDGAVTDTACAYIRNRAEQRPYCLVVGMMLPHNPLICERTLFEHYLGILPRPQPPSAETLERLHPAMRLWRQRHGVDELSVEQHHRGLAAYHALVEQMDGNVGRVVDAVRSRGDDTIIIYCADHGDMASEHGMWWKSTFYDGSSRVPFIVSWPGHVPQGARCDAVASLIDVAPTLLEWAGCEPLPDATGQSFARLLADPPDNAGWNHEAFSEVLGSFGNQPSCMLRSGPWKLVYFAQTSSYQLFNLELDPEEADDRRDDPQTRGVANSMIEKVHRRWSAADRLTTSQRGSRARALINRCGHAPIPHAVSQFRAAEGDNHFDFDQLPAASSS
jgi:choline-sulfatase